MIRKIKKFIFNWIFSEEIKLWNMEKDRFEQEIISFMEKYRSRWNEMAIHVEMLHQHIEGSKRQFSTLNKPTSELPTKVPNGEWPRSF